MLNKAQVNVLFAREAILLGSKDGVPMERVQELFGQEAVDKVSKFGKCGVHFNIFGCEPLAKSHIFIFSGSSTPLLMRIFLSWPIRNCGHPQATSWRSARQSPQSEFDFSTTFSTT